MSLRIGIYDHLGWAIAVAASRDHEVVARQRIDLVEPGVPSMPIHHPGPARSAVDVGALVARVRASAMRATTVALEALAVALPGSVLSLHLRALPVNFPADIADQLRPPFDARADAVMYREVLASIAAARGWFVQFYDARTVEAAAASVLDDRADAVLRSPRERLGPPWTREHRIALAATVLASVE